MMTADERGEIEELLPWHAAGTLDRREAQRVEAALAEDAELARRYQLVREELVHTTHLNETLGAPSVRALEALFAKIDAEPQRRPGTAPGIAMRIGEFFASLSPRALAWSACAAALAILLQAAVIGSILIKEKAPGSYETASVPTSPGTEGTDVLMRFQPQATVSDINRFLETNKLSIARGPSAGGIYRVHVSGAKLSKDEATRVLNTLQQNRIVGFVAITH
ncbi:MAG TPA: hypothetical protein VKV77_01975 [Methylovirgula sp.]|nr:hypothetical protein [Methylovirgula sp.]